MPARKSLLLVAGFLALATESLAADLGAHVTYSQRYAGYFYYPECDEVVTAFSLRCKPRVYLTEKTPEIEYNTRILPSYIRAPYATLYDIR